MATGADEREGTITTDGDSASWTVRLHGEHDVATARALREAIAGAGAAAGPVVVDLRACTFIDSSVIAELLAARRDQPVSLLLSPAGDGTVRRTLKLCGVLDLFAVGDGGADGQAAPA